MAALSGLREQNPQQDPDGHGINELSSLLPEMQTGNSDRRKRSADNRHQRRREQRSAGRRRPNGKITLFEKINTDTIFKLNYLSSI